MAHEIAQKNHFRTEETKVQLELGLVALLLGEDAEARRWIEGALERHEMEGFVKGQKKALHCLGYLNEVACQPDEAIRAYEASLELNQTHFDLLGLILNHQALARLRTGDARALHFARAIAFQAQLAKADQPDE